VLYAPININIAPILALTNINTVILCGQLFDDKGGVMKRSISKYLNDWRYSSRRKPLLLRGARQVGKTWVVRNFAQQFEYFCEVNFEEDEKISVIFNGPLTPTVIINKLSAYTGIPIQAEKTLLFFDEIQACPNALRSLRFFKEKLPELHIISAGSLLEFALGEIPSFGVGRIQSLFMYPMSFKEFLISQDEEILLDNIEKRGKYEPIPEPLFSKLVGIYQTYLIIGGFPAVVNEYIKTGSINDSLEVIDELIQGFRDDFSKYKKNIPQLRIDETFISTATQAGGKFKYSKVNQDLPAYQIKDALNLLILAGLAHKIYHSSAQGIPLHAQVNEKRFKVIPCDTGIYQRMLGANISDMIVADKTELINKGAVAEIATGTELLAYSSPKKSHYLYYWHRESRGSNAEVDYLIELNGEIIPVEVKSGTKGSMQSLRLFLDSHKSSYGIRTSLENGGEYDNIKVIPACTLFNIFSQ